MKKLLLFAVAVFAIAISSLSYLGILSHLKSEQLPKPKAEILRVGLVADSHSENELLAKALAQLKSGSVDFVIGLGDYTNLGKMDELAAAKGVFDESGVAYYVIPGDRDGWENRENGQENSLNFAQTFGSYDLNFSKNGVRFVLVDNSDLYKGISDQGWQALNTLDVSDTLTFVFAHKTPFHPDSAHIMGAESPEVADQAKKFMELMENKKVGGFFSGDLHFFARFNSPSASVRITTIGAVVSERNFQGPRFGILKVFEDYSWEVEDVEIR